MLSATFAALALTLAAIGLYGVLACTVSADDRNRSPNGPGGNGSEVFRLVIGEGLRLTAAGLVFGIAGSIAVGRLLTTMLFGVGPGNLRVFAGPAAVLVAAAALACVIRARRATRVDPMVALRAE
jgi:putative ABC transport system permease protein